MFVSSSVLTFMCQLSYRCFITGDIVCEFPLKVHMKDDCNR